MNDVFEAARNKINAGLIHSFFNSDGSYSQSGEYYLLSPLRADKHVSSFHINESTGAWFDHATGEGGDFIELVSKAFGIGLRDAAEKILKESGGYFVEASETGKKKKAEKDYPDPRIPIDWNDSVIAKLKERISGKWQLENWGTPTKVYRYFNEAGEMCFCVVRFEKEKKKEKREKNDILFYYGTDGNWYAKRHEKLKPFPIYGVEKLKDSKNPVLLVEGEKCANVSVPGYDVVSWMGGSANVRSTDWKPLLKKEVIIWPDTDSQLDKNKEYYLPREIQPGMKAAMYIKSVVPQAKILEIYRNKPVEENPSGWDIADHVEEGGDPVEFIEEFLPYKSVAVSIDPYEVYRKFIENYYNTDNLEQSGGRFWIYDEERHYWYKVLKNDIVCNLQRWLEDTGLQWVISAKLKATKFINEVKQYIDRHSLGYLKDNIFRDSAVSPYVHLQNGAVKITKTDVDWYPRGKYDENFFRDLHPINCLDFDYDEEKKDSIDPEKDCPGFYYFCKDLIPREYTAELSDEKLKNEIEVTLNYIAQIIAYSISTIKPNEYFFGIYGPQRTGKTFFIKIIKSIIGDEFCVERKISDMDNRFASSVLWGKKVFIEPDLKTRQPLPEDFIKSYAGDQKITIEEKNLPPVHGVAISMSLFFVSNYEFHAKGMEGLARRMVMIPYKNDIENHDAHLLDKIMGEYPHGKESGEREGETFDERPAIFALAMKAWKRFCKNNYIIEAPQWAKEEKNNWIIEANSVASFLEETYFALDKDYSGTRVKLYEEYRDWCKSDGKTPLGKKNFYEEVRRDKRIIENRMKGYDSFVIPSSQTEFEDTIPF